MTTSRELVRGQPVGWRSKRRALVGVALAALLASVTAACGRGPSPPAATPTTNSPLTTSTTTPPPTTATTTAPATTLAPTTSTPSTSAPSTSVPAQGLGVNVYFVRVDKIAVVRRTVPSTRAVAAAALGQLLAGPSADDVALGLATTVPAGTRLLDVSITDGIATVDLSSEFALGGGSLSMVARLAQVTYTVTQFPSVSGVLFEMNGVPVTVLGGEGIILDHPATRDSFESVTPGIFVESPAPAQSVRSPLRVTGTANVFEAQFRMRLTTATGQTLVDVPVRAASGTGTRGVFDVSAPFAVSAPANATLTVWDASAKDGSPIDVVDIPLVLVPGP